MNDERLAPKPIHPHETEEYVLLSRAVDALRAMQELLDHYVRPEDDTTFRDLEYDLDCYLVKAARGRA